MALTPERFVELEKELREIAARARPKPKPKPKPVLVATQELGPEALRAKHERAQARLIEAEKAQARERELAGRRYQEVLDAWVEDRRRIEAHERWMRRQLDPCGLGLYGPLED